MTIRTIRVEAGLSLRHVADRIGISHVALGEIERGIRPLPARLRSPIAETLGVTIDKIAGRAPLRIDVASLTPNERERVAAFVAEIRAAMDVA